MKRIKEKKEPLDTELIIKNPKAVRVNLTHMVRRAILAIFQVVIATRNRKAVNQNIFHTENRVMGRVPMPTRVAMENLMVTKKRSHGRHGGHGKSPFKHVMHYKNKLGLTDAQIQTMKELDADFKKKIIQAKADHQIAHVELDLQVHSGKVDEAKIRAAGAKIVASKTNKIMAMIDAKIQLLNLLTAEQRQKMAKMH